MHMPPGAQQVLEINDVEPVGGPDPFKGIHSYSVIPASHQMWPRGIGPVSLDLYFQENLDPFGVNSQICCCGWPSSPNPCTP